MAVCLESPMGRLWVCERDGALCGVSWAHAQGAETALERAAARQLREYFAGERREFDLPLTFNGTPFQQRVWASLRQIPYGQTRTYGEIAVAIGSPRAARAVGGACNRNPLAIVVPCHRVVGASGLTGFAGGLDAKRILLNLER